MDNKTKKKKKTFFEKYDLYSDANPQDTIRISYKNLESTKATILKLEKLFKSSKITHARNVQIANVMTQRLRVINDKDPRYKLSLKYFNHLKQRTLKKGEERKKMIFKIN